LGRHFTKPLGLDATGYDVAIPADLKHGWFDFESFNSPDAAPTRDVDVLDFPNEALITTTYTAGGMTSSLADLLSWGAALYSGAALSPAMRDLLLASPCVEDPETGRWHGFGVVGYGTRSADGSWPAYGHAGNIVGSSAFVASFPGSRTTVAVHANVQDTSTETFIALAFELAEIATSHG
jgi:CubicO group peptidase (beta-lactamase class C family)